MAIGVEGDAFNIPVAERFHLDELGVHVVRAAFGHGRECIRGHAIPRRHADIDAVLHRLGTEIRAPLPRTDRDLDGAAGGIDAERTIAAVDDRTDVAFLEAVDRNQLEDRLIDFGRSVRRRHAVDLGRVEEPVGVFRQPENGGTILGLVAAQTLEDRRAIMHDMGQHMDSGVVPIDQCAIQPPVLSVHADFVFNSGQISPHYDTANPADLTWQNRAGVCAFDRVQN